MASRRRIRDPERIALRTTLSGGHTHVAQFDDHGRGRTSTDAGHFHWIDELDVRPAPDGHTHELTQERVSLEPDRPPSAPAHQRRRAA